MPQESPDDPPPPSQVPGSSLVERITRETARVAVIGLGYVGLPLALRAAEVGFTVAGIDVDPDLVDALRLGRSPLLDVPDSALEAQLREGRLTPTTDPAACADADVVLICVPTPVRGDLPDLSYVEKAAAQVAATLHRDELVVLESTTYPGTTGELLRGILETSGLEVGEDFFLGFSPERINPGQGPGQGGTAFRHIPKIVGGVDEMSTALMQLFYGALVEDVVPVSSPAVAEMAKLLENTYRHVNIALVNEIAILCHDLGIDVWEVIDAARTKPFGFQAFYPGPGWGGHCIPVDPSYLSWRVRQMGETARFVELAREINHRMPAYVVQRISEALNGQGRSLRGSSVLVLGVAYKPDVADTRESPSLEIMARLLQAGCRVSYDDPHVDWVTVDGLGIARTPIDEGALAAADLVVVLTDHSAFDWGLVASSARLVLDTRNALKGRQGGKRGQVIRL